MSMNQISRLSLMFSKVCDGNHDCAMASDECQPQCIKSVFSDEKSMIKNKGMLASVTTIGKKIESFKYSR